MANRIFALSDAAYQRGTDYDIVMLYQVLLGRNPENSTVIQDHRANSLERALHSFVTSQEFVDSVLDPIRNGRSVRRHDQVPRPSPDQLNWLFSRTVLDEAQRIILRQATTWEYFFQYLCSLDGFLEPLPAPPPAPPEPATARLFRRPTPVVLPPPEPPPVAGPSNADLLAILQKMQITLDALANHLLPVDQDASDPKRKASNRRQAR